MHAAIPPPLVNRMTDRCKNITLPQTSFADSNNNFLEYGQLCSNELLHHVTRQHSSRMYTARLPTVPGGGGGIFSLPPVNRQTPVKTLPSRNYCNNQLFSLPCKPSSEFVSFWSVDEPMLFCRRLVAYLVELEGHPDVCGTTVNTTDIISIDCIEYRNVLRSTRSLAFRSSEAS